MTYEQTIDYLFNRLPNYQKQGKSAYKADLSNITALCNVLDNPQEKIKTIHVAGTNGKGSTCHMLSSVFQEAGYKVGLFTSPHLLDFRERIKINGEMISKEDVVSFVGNFLPDFEKINSSFFEWSTALAFHYFEKYKVDIAIIETGLGGRLDSTNIINPELSIITNISLDHGNILGNTLEEIAIEKAGIIKPNTSVVIGDENDSLSSVISERANSIAAPIYFSESNSNYSTDLKGLYQKHNINTVLKAIETLNPTWSISEQHIKDGLLNITKNTKIRGRWEILSQEPKTICDVGHNEAGVREIVKQLLSESFDKLHIIWGMASDKDIESILNLLPKSAIYYFCAANTDRALKKDTLLLSAKEHSLKGNTYKSVTEAFETAKKNCATQRFNLYWWQYIYGCRNT